MAYSFVKFPVYVNAKYLNDVNDATLQGALSTTPSGVGSQGQQTLPGDRICLDDATALALSDTAVGTLYGGIYEYVQTLSTSTASPAVGSLAFFTLASVGSATSPYQVTADAQPLTTLPSYIAGVFINAITKGNYGWIQVAGIASVLFDSTVTAVTQGNLVIAKASATVASTADNTNVTNPSAPVVAAVLGVSVGTVTTSTVTKVAITRAISRI